ncbi:DUF2029 domain-containing protein [bacterium]|nr:DUF2029 domain-containing protein [bacterium]
MEQWIGLDFSSYSWRERILFRILILIALVYFFLHICNAWFIKPELKHQRDFATYYAASLAMQQDKPFHNQGDWPMVQENPLANIKVFPEEEPPPLYLYVYPPFLAWLLIPLTKLDYTTAERFWNYGNISVYLLTVFLFLRFLARKKWLSRFEIFLATLFALLWSPAAFTIWGGQISLWILFFLVLHILLFKKNRECASGVALGLSILIKVSPLMFLGLWILQRKWKLTAACLFTIGMGIFLSGWQETMHFFSAIFPHMSLGENHPVNITLMGAFLTQAIGYPWAWLSEAQYQSIFVPHTVIRLGLLLGWITVYWGTWKQKTQAATWLHYSIIVISMLFLTPVARLYDFVYLYPALVWAYVEWKKDKTTWLLASTLFLITVFTLNLGEILHAIASGFISPNIIDKTNVFAVAWLWVCWLIRQKMSLYPKTK